MSDQPNYSNEDINQLLGLEFRPVTLTEEENNELVFDNESIEIEETNRKSWSSNPWAKLGLIGGVLGFVFLGIGTFVTVTGNLANSSNLQANQSEHEETTEDTGPSEAETLAALKAKAALAGQESELNRLKSIDEQQEQPPETNLVSSEPQQPVKAVSPPPPPRPQTVAVRPTPKPVPKPVRTASRPSTPPVRQTPPSVTTQTVDPLQQWQTLAQIGSYGGGESSESTSAGAVNEAETTNQVALANSSHNTSSIIPRTQPIPGTNHGVPRVPTRVAQNINQNSHVSEEERFLSGNTTSQQITIGQRATAVLESSLISESNGGQNDFVERFVVTLSTPLSNEQGVEILPTGTPMLVAVRSVHDSGKVTAVVESVVKNGQEITLPSGAMFLRDAGGNPLMASLMPSGQRERMGANATTFVMGALSKTGELLNRGSTSTFISGGNFSQSQQFNEPNYIGGLLEGGFTPLAERMNQQHENSLSNLDSRTPLWIVEQGTTVEVFVNQTINF
ncbi:hypothetical protein CWATWH0402_5022 [Crocosphaera watsonii WH 0402]|uniref:Uncharacterized protein n=1 Tax=Crocosphaera watsonii WH 0402 TaxID=1284629 RepID=T2K0Z0_CROWT|nr:TrbI/VirB10 family protein [Crocosphaera watsonii]CCQ71017.1 hypothetical protein CWATWH0402_5022 [Crocosphaera watsonii WH 0402]